MACTRISVVERFPARGQVRRRSSRSCCSHPERLTAQPLRPFLSLSLPYRSNQDLLYGRTTSSPYSCVDEVLLPAPLPPCRSPLVLDSAAGSPSASLHPSFLSTLFALKRDKISSFPRSTLVDLQNKAGKRVQAKRNGSPPPHTPSKATQTNNRAHHVAVSSCFDMFVG